MTQCLASVAYWTNLPRATERTTTAPLPHCPMRKGRRGVHGLCRCGSVLPPYPRRHLHTSIAAERQIKDPRATPTHWSKRASTSGHTCLSTVTDQQSGASSVMWATYGGQNTSRAINAQQRPQTRAGLTGRQSSRCNGRAQRKCHERHRAGAARSRVRG